MLAQVFGLKIAVAKPVGEPDFPPGLHVYQLRGRRVTRSAIDYHGDKPPTLKPVLREALKREVKARLDRWKMRPKVGIITFQDIEEDCRQALGELGLKDDRIISDHYYNVRGENTFTGCRLLVLVGYPNPNPQGLYEEACALFSGEKPVISREAQRWDSHLVLRNGRKLAVQNIFGYKDARLQALLLQKSRSELYQAFHRARPLVKTRVREVLILTDVVISDNYFCR